MGCRLDITANLPLGALQQVAAPLNEAISAIAQRRADWDCDAVNIHACKCIWLAAPFGRAARFAAKERDWVVVGSTRDELLRMNYREVGRDFRCSASDSREEYALARRERKTAPGYRGFAVEFGTRSHPRGGSRAPLI